MLLVAVMMVLCLWMPPSSSPSLVTRTRKQKKTVYRVAPTEQPNNHGTQVHTTPRRTTLDSTSNNETTAGQAPTTNTNTDTTSSDETKATTPGQSRDRANNQHKRDLTANAETAMHVPRAPWPWRDPAGSPRRPGACGSSSSARSSSTARSAPPMTCTCPPYPYDGDGDGETQKPGAGVN